MKTYDMTNEGPDLLYCEYWEEHNVYSVTRFTTDEIWLFPDEHEAKAFIDAYYGFVFIPSNRTPLNISITGFPHFNERT